MQKYIMALDQGTTTSRCIIFNQKGETVSLAQKEFTQTYPQIGWVEHNPNEIWESILYVMRKAQKQAFIDIKDIVGIGITNQRETTVVWNKNTGNPVYNAIVWQCRRTSHIVEELKAKGLDKLIKSKTGLIVDAYFSATKIKWILDNVEGQREEADKGNLLFGTIDTWLMWKLSQGNVFATDYTNASRTMLYNIHELKWDKELLHMFNIPINMLPEVKPSGGIFGTTSTDITEHKIPISAVAGDQQSALFGQCCFNKGDAKNTYGTGCFLLMNTGEKAPESKNGLITTIAIGSDNKIEYALEGSVFIAGAAIQWLRDELRIIKTAKDSEAIATSVEDSNGVYVVPAFTGLGAPYWDQYAKGAILGLTRGAKREHIVRATLESLAYQTYDVLKVMEEESGNKLIKLKADGGASENNFLLQFQANILNRQVERPYTGETTALGIAYLAGLNVDYWKSKEQIKANWKVAKTFKPNMDEEKRISLLEGWKDAVGRVRS